MKNYRIIIIEIALKMEKHQKVIQNKIVLFNDMRM